MGLKKVNWVDGGVLAMPARTSLAKRKWKRPGKPDCSGRMTG